MAGDEEESYAFPRDVVVVVSSNVCRAGAVNNRAGARVVGR